MRDKKLPITDGGYYGCSKKINFATELLQNRGRGFIPEILHIWTKIFRQDKDLTTVCGQPKIYGVQWSPSSSPSATMYAADVGAVTVV